ncbi:MAG TPA: porin [Noviherbaspirillum sp.]|jgi:predicted porin|uniref:porin n=1 Tax=Noviherbaspirillum sp. TaxID=1926288 RepID=UPI002F957C15
MKKSLLALAVLGAFAASAQAQTNVTIYGSFDGGVRWVNNANAAGESNVTMGSNGQFNRNRIGFKGVEDLGGGLNAHFTLESGWNTGTGALDNAANRLFNRSAFVGIGGSWGSLDFGRQYSVNFKTIGLYDPFSYKFTSLVPLAGIGGLTWVNNDVQYTGNFGPITARASWAFGETPGDNTAGASRALGVGYTGGPISAGAAYTVTTSVTDVDTKVSTVGGAYNFGAFRVAAGFARTDTEGAAGAEIDDAWVGGSFNVSPAVQLTAGYYRTKSDAAGDPRRNTYIVGATYALSKRTNLYFDIDHSRFSGGNPVIYGVTLPAAATEDRVTGVSIGVNHLF